MINTNNLNLRGFSTITNPNNKEIFNRYLNEIAKYHPLTKEEEINLFKKLKEEPTNKIIIDKLCKHNLLFVITIAKQYAKVLAKSSLTLEDLVNEGNLGLCKAIHRYDYTLGNKFISYAVWWIKQHILSCIQANIKSIRIPNHIRAEINKFNKEEIKLEQILNYKPNTSEIFESMLASGTTKIKNTVERFDELLNISHNETSLSNLVNRDGNTELSELLESEDENPNDLLLKKERKNLISKLLDSIPLDIRDYYIDYYGIDGQKPLSIIEMGIKYEQKPTTIKMRMERYLRRMRYDNINMREYFFPSKQKQLNY